MGGLPRRTTALNTLRTHQPALVVDAGGTLSPKDVSDLDAARRKASLVGRVLARDGVDALTLSARDWRLGKGFIDGLIAEHSLPVLAANLVCDGARPHPASVVVERGAVRFGIVGVTDGVVPGCDVHEPGPALREALGALPEVDITVALVPGSRQRLKPLEELDVDVVVATTSVARLALGETLPLGAQARGKSLQVLEVSGAPGSDGAWSSLQRASLRAELARRQEAVARQKAKVAKTVDADDKAIVTRRLAFEERELAAAEVALAAYGDGEGAFRAEESPVPLGDEVADDPETAALVAALLEELEGRVGTPIPDDAPRLVGGRGPYAGSDACQGCHPTQHAQWSGTRHAVAWSGLRDDQHGMDPACVGCHVTGWKEQGGPQRVQDLAPYRGVQCEACHGPARAHTRDPAGHTPVADVPLSTCTGCHDGEQDMGRFDAETYLPKVVHSPHGASPGVGTPREGEGG